MKGARISKRFSGAARRSRAALVLLAAGGVLAACQWPAESLGGLTCKPGEDLALVDLGLEAPQPPPVDMSKIPVDIVKRHFHGATLMRSQLIRHDFAGVQAHWDRVQAMPDPTERMRAVLRSTDALSGKGLYILQSAQRWHAQQPESPAAQLMLGMAYMGASAEVRGTELASDTPPEKLHWMAERFARGWTLLEPLTQRSDVYADAARLASIFGHFSMGESERGWAHYVSLLIRPSEVLTPIRAESVEALRQAQGERFPLHRAGSIIQRAPQYEWLYLRALNFAKPQWAGAASKDRYQAIMELAESNQLSAPHLITLRQAIANDFNPISSNPNPQAWRPYWEQRIQQAPTIANYADFLQAEMQMQNWANVVEVSGKLLELNPERADGWNSRAYALERMGRVDKAFDALVAAVSVGDDWAMDRLVNAYSRGGYGRPSNDLATLYEYCKLGAALGLPSAANCMGAAHTDGFSGSPRNDRAALAWHLQGARGGHTNSQHDVAVLLPRVLPADTPGLDVSAVSDFWLRRAADGGHKVAALKLESRSDEAPSGGLVCRLQSRLAGLFDLLGYLRSVFVWL